MATAYQMIQQLRLETEEGAITPSRLADVLETILEEGVANGSGTGGSGNTGGTTTPTNPGGNTGDNTGGNSGDNSGNSNNGDNTGSEESDVYSIKITLSDAGTFSHPDCAEVNIPAEVETTISIPTTSKKDGLISRKDGSDLEFSHVTVDIGPNSLANVRLSYYLGNTKINKLYIQDTSSSPHRYFYDFLKNCDYVKCLIFKYSNSLGFADLYRAFFASKLVKLDLRLWPDVGYDTLRSPNPLFFYPENVNQIVCRQSFKDWYLSQSNVDSAFKEGGSCEWSVVDDPNFDPDGTDPDDW